MGQIRKRQQVAICVAFVVFAGWAGAAPTDPVEEIKAILRLSDAEPTEAMFAFRREKLAKAIARLQTIGELRRALALPDWTGFLTKPAALIKIETDARNEIGELFTKQVENVVEHGDATSRLAVANMIGEMGPNVRSLKVNGKEDPGGFARGLAPLVVKLAQDARADRARRSLAVRQEALRALGGINADPKIAVPELEAALSDAEVGPRRIAADALVQMIKIVGHLSRPGLAQVAVVTPASDVVSVCSAVLPASRKGLRDPDPQVMTMCLEAGREAALALSNSTLLHEDQDQLKRFPPPGLFAVEANDKASRERKDMYRKEVESAYEAVREAFRQLEPLLKELDKQSVATLEVLKKLEGAPATSRASGPPIGYFGFEEAQLRLAGVESLLHLAEARSRMQGRLESVPIREIRRKDPKEPGGGERDLREFDPLRSVLAEKKHIVQITQLLQEPDPPVRRRTVELLELLEDKAAVAIPALTAHLADPDRFVRWASARALGRIAPAQSGAAVLPVAQLVEDPDLNVRKAAAETLEVFANVPELRPRLSQAAPFLARAVNTSNTEVRLAALSTLLSFGAELARPAVPALAEALKPEVAADVRVRQAAAEMLGKLGPRVLLDPHTNQVDPKLLGLVIPALRRAIGDDDAGVRSAASDALLSLIPPRKGL